MKKLLFILIIFSLCVSAYCIRIELNPSNINIGVNDTFTLVKAVRPAHGHYSYMWSCDDTTVCTVEADGTVKGVSPGYANVYCQVNDGVKASCLVHVYDNPNLYLNNYKLNMVLGRSYQLVATASYNTNFYWKSSDNRICEVYKDGTIVAKCTGRCTITCTTDQGDQVNCFVYVYYDKRRIF